MVQIARAEMTAPDTLATFGDIELADWDLPRVGLGSNSAPTARLWASPLAAGPVDSLSPRRQCDWRAGAQAVKRNKAFLHHMLRGLHPEGQATARALIDG